MSFRCCLLVAAVSAAASVAAVPPDVAAVQGDVALPLEAVVFGPFSRADGVPEQSQLRRLPDALTLGGKTVVARRAAFDARRCLDCASFTGPEVGGTAWVYLPFTAGAAAPVTFGFGADWWYEAYLDGELISETLSRGDQGNGSWPPSIFDFTSTVAVPAGEHVLAVRFLRGSGSAALAVGGPRDLRNPAIRNAPKPAGATPGAATVTKAAARQGPPEGKQWRLVWREEFDGTALDTETWHVQPQNRWNWPGIKTEPSMDNLYLDGNGALVLQLTRDPDGTVRHFGSINSRFAKAYGYIETRVQFSRQPGWWTAVWMAGYPYDCGIDTFTRSQEFDIFEDFYKPKKINDISHCYHCSVKLERLTGDQGNAKGVGEGGILASTRLGRTSSGRKVVMEEYEGWHTVGFQWTPLEHIFYVDGQETLRQTYQDVPVTNVPQKIWISGCLRTPKSETDKPFYGRLEDAQLPDRLVVDYVRWYEEDTADRRPPAVTLTLKADGPFKQGEPVPFAVTAKAYDTKITKVMLFSMGRIRAEKSVGAPAVDAEFTVTNLFPGVANTVIAMAQDETGLVGQSPPLQLELFTGEEFTGTPWQGLPQAIPGTIQGGCYDEGGSGVAYRSAATGPSDARLEYRKDEIGSLPEAVEVGGDYAQWITYEVDIAAAGEYEVELFMNRPDYSTKSLASIEDGNRNEAIRVHLGSAGSPGEPLLEWQLPTTWNSGVGWRSPQKSLGKKRVRLPQGRRKLVLFCDDVSVKFTFFCRMVFSPVAGE